MLHVEKLFKDFYQMSPTILSIIHIVISPHPYKFITEQIGYSLSADGQM